MAGQHAGSTPAARRWRRASNSSVAAATDAFSDCTLPRIGMNTGVPAVTLRHCSHRCAPEWVGSAEAFCPLRQLRCSSWRTV